MPPKEQNFGLGIRFSDRQHLSGLADDTFPLPKWREFLLIDADTVGALHDGRFVGANQIQSVTGTNL